jgi:hypothetical protein
MSGRREGGRAAPATGAGAVVAALKSLDPFSFWVVPTAAGDTVVAGTTGVFLVRAESVEGVVVSTDVAVRVGGRRFRSRRIRAAAGSVGRTMARASVATSVEPVVCFTRAMAGPPATVRGIRYAAAKDLAGDLAGRRATLSRERAQRAARALGMEIAGDKYRHFSPS